MSNNPGTRLKINVALIRLLRVCMLQARATATALLDFRFLEIDMLAHNRIIFLE